MELRNAEPLAAYLAAAIDGEGYIKARIPKGRRRPQRLISIVNTEREFISACEEACDALGIQYRLRTRETPPPCKPLHELVISRRSELEKVEAVVPLRHPQKVEALRVALTTYRPPPPLEKVRTLFDKGATIAETAAALGISAGMVCHWQRQLGLSRRGPGRPRLEYPVDEWVRLYQAGATYEEIARQSSVSSGTVWNRLRERGTSRSAVS